MTDKQIHKAIERNSGALMEESEKNGIMVDRVDVDGLTADIQKKPGTGSIKILVTITTCDQIGHETWRESHEAKVFNENTTLGDIDNWIKSIDKNTPLSSAIFANVAD